LQAFAAKVKQNKEKMDNGISYLTVFLSESDNLCILKAATKILKLRAIETEVDAIK